MWYIEKGKKNKMSDNKIVIFISALILSLGIFGAGYNVGKGIYILKKMSRSITVKGLAEKDVNSDLGIWEINYRELGNDLVKLDQTLQKDQQIVVAFLKQQGFTDQEIDFSQLKVEDRLANVYSQTDEQTVAAQRYVVTGGVRVRSTKVNLIEQTVKLTDRLLQQGVPLAFDVSLISPNPSYYFMQLDSIRPDMLSEATHSAKAIADQFARDSGSKLAGIQHASQGVFQIMSRDTSTLSNDWSSNQNALGSIQKKVRLVTTIEYGLRE